MHQSSTGEEKRIFQGVPAAMTGRLAAKTGAPGS